MRSGFIILNIASKKGKLMEGIRIIINGCQISWSGIKLITCPNVQSLLQIASMLASCDNWFNVPASVGETSNRVAFR